MQNKLSKAVLSGALAAGLLAGPFAAVPATAAHTDTEKAADSGLAVTTAVDDCDLPNFADNESRWSAFYQAVRWMQCEEISVGYPTENVFGKSRDITRGETAAFLHRMVKPADFEAPSESPFGDVNAGGAYYSPITWAEAEGITVGQDDGNFGTSKPVTRGQFAAFLYGLEDPEFTAPEEAPFEDINVDGANYQAISWLAENDISVGDTWGRFHQSDAITRAEMSAMLMAYTQMKEEEPDEDGTKSIEIYSFNDFHGALSDQYSGTMFAYTVEEQRAAFEAEHGEGTTLLTSAGDLIGASASVSNVQQDEPTLRIMNELGLSVSAAGNHEFDKGLDDLTGRVSEIADYSFLAANFVNPDSKEPVLPPYEIKEVDGVRVAVIGAVPNNLYATTTGAGLQGNEVIDMVEGVNAVAEKLSDGVEGEGNEEAEVIVASYHDGAVGNGELADETAASSGFNDIVNKTDPSVDVIFNGHTHQTYLYDTEVEGTSRPVLQAGQSGNLLGAVELKIDEETNEVVDYSAELVEREAAPTKTVGEGEEAEEVFDEEAFDQLLDDQDSEITEAVRDIERSAIGEFEEAQGTVIGDIDASITTDYQTRLENGQDWRAGGTRAAETTLGNWAANALKDRVSLTNEDVDLGVTNSGGLRSELLFDQFTEGGAFGPKPADLEGKVTLGEVLDFAPFGNTLVSFDIPGSSIKQVIEENWREDGSKLHLGWSEELSYTYDDNAPVGEKVTGIWINGEPLQMDEMYTIATLSFLGDTSWVGTENSAPDGYEGFAQGMENYVDLGIADNQAFQEYIQAQTAADEAIRPDFAKKAVEVNEAPDSLAAGDAVSLTLDNLELESDGAGDATTVSVAFQGAQGEPVELGEVDVPTEGETVQIEGITLPGDLPAGDGELVFTVQYDDQFSSTTEVRSPLTVTAAAAE
ncbi:5'-nucleotidase C-terminal domain-containing protein [Citricoccus sp. GCM10030269]|uniref:5'-nucleotidase C-terminal domain-containing protein n=1 Tax=Citricoccus sp. GCM10030269 TaxID=3273388 RepID=UPI0036095320